MNQLTAARDQLLDTYDSTTGKKNFAVVAGKKVRCIIEEMSFDESAISGGITEAGGFRLSSIPRESFARKPEKGDPVKVRGVELEIIGEVINRNDVSYEIQAGSLERDER